MSAPLRVPSPDIVSPISPQLLEELSNFVPPGDGVTLRFPANPLEGSVIRPSESGIHTLIGPIADQAVQDYIGNRHPEPHAVKVSVRRADNNAANEPPRWQKEELYYDDVIYGVGGIEFASGEGRLGIGITPNILLNGVTNRLINDGRLTVTEAGDRLVRAGARHIYRYTGEVGKMSLLLTALGPAPIPQPTPQFQM